MAFDSPLHHWLLPSNPVFIKQPHHLSVQEECACRQGPRTTTATASFSLHFGGDRRGRGSERLTAGLLWLKAFLTGPCSLLVLSLACIFFPSKISLSPSFRCNVPVGYCLEYWNSLCLVLFVRHSVRIPPPTHSWLRNVLWLPSQVSTHFITSLSPRSLYVLFSFTFYMFYLSPSLCPCLSLCSSFQGW